MERKSTFEANEIEILQTSQAIIGSISKELEKISHVCEAMGSIEAANKLYSDYYKKARYKAFKPYETSILKPYLLFRVNNWFKHIIKK